MAGVYTVTIFRAVKLCLYSLPVFPSEPIVDIFSEAGTQTTNTCETDHKTRLCSYLFAGVAMPLKMSVMGTNEHLEENEDNLDHGLTAPKNCPANCYTII